MKPNSNYYLLRNRSQSLSFEDQATSSTLSRAIAVSVKKTEKGKQRPKMCYLQSEDLVRQPNMSNLPSEDHVRQPRMSNLQSEDHVRRPSMSDLHSEDHDRRPSLSELQSEDYVRRPSITMYQLVDTQHPDVREIQMIVKRIKFTELYTKL